MKQAFIHGPGDLRLDEVARPTAGPADVIVKVVAGGICGTDVGFRVTGGPGGLAAKHPVAIGHEFAGEIVEAGPQVKSFKVGDRVAFNSWNSHTGIGRTQRGGFCEYLAYTDADDHKAGLHPLPDNLSFEVAALAEPLSVALHTVNRADPKPGESVAVFGAGPIGLGVIIGLRWRGVEDIVAFDLSPLRRERALALGARAAFDPRDRPLLEALGELRGYAAIPTQPAKLARTDIYIDAAGAPGLIAEIAKICQLGARIVAPAMQKKDIVLPANLILAKELTIMGSIGYPTEFQEVIEKLASGAVDSEALITHRYPFSDFLNAFETAANADVSAKVMVQFD
jgi:2-desacetyl-2-hydroxyethyl bacteriochlorophyllide A dehydrogenase